MKRVILLVTLLLLACVVSTCGQGEPAASPGTATGGADLQLTSNAFASGEPIPARYTCQGDDISPPVRWSNPPPGTETFVLFMDDPDGGDWVHWSLYNLPGTTASLSEAVPPDPELPDGSRQGQNSWGKLGYGGPCPPSGTHQYVFRLYALDTLLDLEAGATKEALFKAVEGHVLAQTEIVGLYSKR
jgi:Raf kinase inhibitor-like YbhB/YbcL family protein